MGERTPKRRDVLIVLLQSGGKPVVPVSVGDKIKVVGLRRVKSGLERTSPGTRDWARREPGMSIGVVGRVELHIIMMQRPAVSSRK